MKTASIPYIRRHLSDVLALIEQGEEISITRRNKVVARIVPAKRQPNKVKMPNFVERMRQNYPHKTLSKRATLALLRELRDER
jgi:prevent-host-death family protein